MSERKQFGRRGGGRKPRDFDQTLVDVARVARVVKGGKRFRFRATIVIGDHKGKVGMGVAKGPDVTTAIAKAVAQAKKNFVHVPLVNETIPHEIKYKYGSATVLLKPARPGTGIIAGGGVRAVAELAGIKNLLSKMLGSANKINNIRAALLGLSLLRLPQAVATARGKKLSDLGIREPKIDSPSPHIPPLAAGVKAKGEPPEAVAKRGQKASGNDPRSLLPRGLLRGGVHRPQTKFAPGKTPRLPVKKPSKP